MIFFLLLVCQYCFLLDVDLVCGATSPFDGFTSPQRQSIVNPFFVNRL